MKWWDYLMEFSFIALCLFSGLFFLNMSNEQKALISGYEKQVAELKEQMDEYRQGYLNEKEEVHKELENALSYCEYVAHSVLEW